MNERDALFEAWLPSHAPVRYEGTPCACGVAAPSRAAAAAVVFRFRRVSRLIDWRDKSLRASRRARVERRRSGTGRVMGRIFEENTKGIFKVTPSDVVCLLSSAS